MAKARLESMASLTLAFYSTDLEHIPLPLTIIEWLNLDYLIFLKMLYKIEGWVGIRFCTYTYNRLKKAERRVLCLKNNICHPR